MKTHYALRSIEHNGVVVYYAVNFQKKQVSITDKEGKKKSFLFAERESQYQKGWHDILEAIKVAMDSWFQELKEVEEKDYSDLVEHYMTIEKAWDCLSSEIHEFTTTYKYK